MSHFLGAVIVPPGIDATLDTVGCEPQDYLADTDIAELQGELATELAKRMIAPHRHQDGEDVFDDPSTLIFPTGDQFDALSLVNDDFLLPDDTRTTRERCTEAIRVLQSAGPAAKILYLDFHG